MHLYVGPMDAVVIDVSEDGRIRLEMRIGRSRRCRSGAR